MFKVVFLVVKCLFSEIQELKVQQGVMAEGGGTTILSKTVQEIVEFDPDHEERKQLVSDML